MSSTIAQELYDRTVSANFLYNEVLDITSLSPQQDPRRIFALVDLRPYEEYEKSHILSSLNVDIRKILRDIQDEGVQDWETLMDRNPGLYQFQQALFKKANYNNQRFIVYDEEDITQETVDQFLNVFLPLFPRNIMTKSLRSLKGGFQQFTSNYGHSLCSDRKNTEERDVTLLPNEIIPGFLYLGSQIHLNDIDSLKQLKITKIVNVTPEPHDEKLKEHFPSFQIKINDHQTMNIKQYFHEAVDFIRDCKKNDDVVLVHCQKGISRSSSIVLAYLVAEEKLTLEQAFTFVRNRRKFIRPNQGFLKQLGEFEMELNPSLRQPTLSGNVNNCGSGAAVCRSNPASPAGVKRRSSRKTVKYY